MELTKTIIGTVLLFIVVYVAVVWVFAKIDKRKKDKIDKLQKDTVEIELKELARWGVLNSDVHVIRGRLTMSIHALITLMNNPEYIAHLRKESLALNLHKNFFEDELRLRIEKAKQRIQARIDRKRADGEQFEVDSKLQELGIK